MRILHAADLHLDSPLEGLPRYEGAPVEKLRLATREALKNLVSLALAEDVKLVLLCGDIYDGDWRDYNTGLFFSAQLAELRRHGVNVAMVLGNHDAENQITKQLKLPDNTHVFSSREAETIRHEELGIALHGRSFAKRAELEDLSINYPPPVPGMVNIGLLHTSLSGRVGHEPYAPSTLKGLRAKGYDYWALGHVHTREVLSEDPWIVFPGNTQGRHMRELGPKGCTLIDIEDGRVHAVNHVDLDVVRWAHLTLDVAEMGSLDALYTQARATLEDAKSAAGDRILAARITLTGQSSLHDELVDREAQWTPQLRSIGTEIGQVWIEKIRVRTSAPVTESPEEGDDHILTLLESLGEVAKDASVMAEMQTIVSDLQSKVTKVPGVLRDAGPLSAEAIARATEEAMTLVRARLGEKARRT